MTDTDWQEYDSAAEWCAKRGYSLRADEPLPPLLSAAVHEEITNHPEEFLHRIQLTAYAAAMKTRILFDQSREEKP